MTSDDGSGRAERVGSGGVSQGQQVRYLPIAEHGLIGDLHTVALVGTDGTIEFATSRLADVETMQAMTIHKSQGSQAAVVTVLMPPEDSRLLTRELSYTAVTRAKTKVRVVGSEAEVCAALARRVRRAGRLRQRLR